jgi:16S rRNA (guanine966-N2)-methyltransferase
MRILQGAWAGRHLVSPAGRVRPTAEEVRDAWLAELEPEIEGARVLELYAGSGAVGLEALSRGAATCDFVEIGAPALHALKANVAALRARDRVRIFKRDALHFIDSLPPDRYDLVLADPPYQSRQLDRLVERWQAEPFSAVLSVEHAADHDLPVRGERLRLGETAITTFRV